MYAPRAGDGRSKRQVKARVDLAVTDLGQTELKNTHRLLPRRQPCYVLRGVDRPASRDAGPALPASTSALVQRGSAAMHKASRSAFSGVMWDRRHGKWVVQIRLGRRHVRLAYLDCDDARRVYLGAKLLLQGFTPVPRAELRLPEVRRPTG
jgi:hypothetical protein